MLHTYRGVIDKNGKVHLLEPTLQPAKLKEGVQVLVSFLDHETIVSSETLMSEAALDDWLRPEEEAAWAYLAELEAEPERLS